MADKDHAAGAARQAAGKAADHTGMQAAGKVKKGVGAAAEASETR